MTSALASSVLASVDNDRRRRGPARRLRVVRRVRVDRTRFRIIRKKRIGRAVGVAVEALAHLPEPELPQQRALVHCVDEVQLQLLAQLTLGLTRISDDLTVRG